MLAFQIAYSNAEKGKCTFEKFPVDQGNDCCFYEPDCIVTKVPEYKTIYVWVSMKNYFPEIPKVLLVQGIAIFRYLGSVALKCKKKYILKCKDFFA